MPGQYIYSATIGEWLQGIVGPGEFAFLAHWPIPAAFSFGITNGFHSCSVDHFAEFPGNNTSVHICLGAPINEPVGVRHALLSGAAALGMAFVLNDNVPEPTPIGEMNTLVDTLASIIAGAMDHATTGTADVPVVKFIAAALDKVWTWTVIIAVAADSEWLVVQYQFTAYKENTLEEFGVAFGPVRLPAASHQVSYPTGLSPATLSELTAAVLDVAHKTTVVSLADQGPRFVVESSEIIT